MGYLIAAILGLFLVFYVIPVFFKVAFSLAILVACLIGVALICVFVFSIFMTLAGEKEDDDSY